jgi:hypothetical protein
VEFSGVMSNVFDSLKFITKFEQSLLDHVPYIPLVYIAAVRLSYNCPMPAFELLSSGVMHFSKLY